MAGHGEERGRARLGWARRGWARNAVWRGAVWPGEAWLGEARKLMAAAGVTVQVATSLEEALAL